MRRESVHTYVNPNTETLTAIDEEFGSTFLQIFDLGLKLSQFVCCCQVNIMEYIQLREGLKKWICDHDHTLPDPPPLFWELW